MTMEASTETFADLAAFESIVIHHAGFAEAVSHLQQIIEMCARGANPRHALLLGQSGTGKTWVAKYLQAMYPNDLKGEYATFQIICVETPAAPSIKSLAESLLIALQDPAPDRGTTTAKRARALHFAKLCKVRMIIFDEFQHFIDNGQSNSLQSVADWLKGFIDECGIPCVLMGLPRSAQILRINEQLRRRFSTHLQLLPFSIKSHWEFEEFQVVLNEFDMALPHQAQGRYAEPETAKRMYYASNGLIGYVRKLIVGAYELSMLGDHKEIDHELLRRVFIRDIWRDAPQELNPFAQGSALRKLDRPGEPFEIALPTMRKSARVAA